MSNDIAVTANPIVALAAAFCPVVSPAAFVNVTVGLDAYSPPLPTTIVSTENDKSVATAAPAPAPASVSVMREHFDTQILH